MLEERAARRSWWEAWREGWMEEEEFVRPLRREGLERMSARSWMLFVLRRG
jgi:hypothetical protein